MMNKCTFYQTQKGYPFALCAREYNILFLFNASTVMDTVICSDWSLCLLARVWL